MLMHAGVHGGRFGGIQQTTGCRIAASPCLIAIGDGTVRRLGCQQHCAIHQAEIRGLEPEHRFKIVLFDLIEVKFQVAAHQFAAGHTNQQHTLLAGLHCD